jgi:outer membrane protein assembly factor BamA
MRTYIKYDIMPKSFVAAVFLAVCLNTPLCFAQKTASEAERQQELLEEEAVLRQKISVPEKVFIKKVNINGAKELSENQIREITLAFEGRWLDKEDARQIADVLARAYEKSGIKLTADQIKVEIEGDILEVRVENTTADQKEKESRQ